MNYRPYTKEDKLEAGTKIRLGGLVGVLEPITSGNSTKHFRISFENGEVIDCICIEKFNFEIEDTPPPPRKIDKMVKERLKEIVEDEDEYPSESLCQIMAYLNSLEEC